MRGLLVVLGIAAGQVVLFGSSLAGEKLLLPLDILAAPGIYLPSTTAYRGIEAHNPVLSDLVYGLEFDRRFAATELRAGRLPLWTPHQYAGAPAAVWGKYSPFNLLYFAFPSPRTLPWIALLEALVAGIGAFVFFRRVLATGFWPAAVGAWCFPVTGYFTLWQLYPTTSVIAWLPWVLLATDAAVRRPRGRGGPGLALATALTWLSGQVDVAAQVLLVSGIYALWCLSHGRVRGHRRWSVAAAASGWLLGTALATPYLLPLVEYSATGARLVERSAGVKDQPPVGLVALPEVVLPEFYGSLERDSVRLLPGNRLRGAATAYAGLIAALVLAPLAFASRRHRALNTLWLVLGFLGLAWILDVPGVVELLRLPLLRLLPFNRFAFATAFAVLALAVVGIDVLWRGPPAGRRWFALPAVLLSGLGVAFAYRALHLPTPVAEVGGAAARGFAQAHAIGALLAFAGAGCWGALGLVRGSQRVLAPALGALVLAELLWFGSDLNPETDPRLYYPKIPVLSALAAAPPGRVLGVACLPARLAETHGLRDIRGYDGVDPARLMDLMDLAAAEGGSPPLSYARTQFYNARIEPSPPDAIVLSPLLDMLGVRYLVFRGEPPPGFTPLLASPDYWVLENRKALPRAFVPRRVETIPEPARRLARLGAADFDARSIAFVERPLELPSGTRGSAAVIVDHPGRVVLEAELDAPGLVVLADLWDAGWSARRDGEAVPILRVNHALRGVVAPAGRSRIEFRYWPRSLSLGLALAGAALLGLGAWTGVVWSPRRARNRTGD